MTYLLMILMALLCQSESILNKKCNQRVENGGFILTGLISVFSMLFFVVKNIGTLHFATPIIPYGVIGGLLFCSATFTAYLALGLGSYAITLLVLSYSLLFNIGYGVIFRGEHLTLWIILGIACVIASLFFCSGEGTKEKKASLKWVIILIVALITSGMFSVVSKMQLYTYNNKYSNEFMIISLGISATVLIIAGCITNGKSLGKILKNCSLYAFGAGVSNGCANTFGFFIVASGMPLSISEPMNAGIKILLSYAISLFIFKERFTLKQTVGAVLGTASLVLLNIK